MSGIRMFDRVEFFQSVRVCLCSVPTAAVMLVWLMRGRG